LTIRFAPLDIDSPLQGKAYVFGDNVPGDDGIVPFTVVSNIYETATMDFGSLAMTPVDPTFPMRFVRGGFLIAGQNFPTGIAHEQAIWALVQVGVAAVIVETMAAGFFQAAINDGLPAFALPGITSLVREGDPLEVVLRRALVRNLATGKELRGTPMPERIAVVLQAGGTRAYVAAKYRKQRAAAPARS
jgi:3-isopropylmalate/(R)-2-methylmalate dehydratase small subunit